MYVCRGYLDKYISAAIWPPQTKIPSSTPGCHYFILEISTLYSLVILVVLTLFTCYLKNVTLPTQGLLLDFSNPPHHLPFEEHF